MQLPLRVTFKGMESSPSLQTHIAGLADKLDHLYGRIMSCRVVIEAPHRHQHKGKLYRVVVDITVPGAELVINRSSQRDHAHEDVHVALRDAFDAAARKLEDYARRQRGDVKSHVGA